MDTLKARLSYDFLRKNGLALLEEGKDFIKLAATQRDPYLEDLIYQITGKRVILEEVSRERLDSLLKESIPTFDIELDEEGIDEKELENIASEAPVVKFVNDIINDAILKGATDIHIEQFEEDVEIRYRIDGVLHTLRKLPKYVAPPVVSRIKILAKLNIAEKRLPQDGKFSHRLNSQEFDIRVSTLPSIHGESVVMRLLKKGELNLSLNTLGFSQEDLGKIREFIKKPYGMLLVTGPTGSGKTTTLYSAIKEINLGDRKIITVEDPVEYTLKGLVQVQVNPKIGLTFASALRTILRQDPDVIMVGEIRDPETAQIAVQASLTGHLVLATLHTNDAPSAFTRLIDMGVEEFLIASAVVGVMSQRLVRKICEECKEAYEPSREEADTFRAQGLEVPGRLFRGKGCGACEHTGYRGRTVIAEVLKVNDEIRSLIIGKADASVIREKAIRGGMTPLLKDGLEKAARGITTLEEVLRVSKE